MDIFLSWGGRLRRKVAFLGNITGWCTVQPPGGKDVKGVGTMSWKQKIG
jgi:hypothetical protein